MNEYEHDPAALELQALAAQDRLRLAVAQNVAANGRWFCALLALINAASGHPVLALFAALPIGLSVLVDQAPADGPRVYVRLGIYALAVLVAASTLIVNW